MDAKETGCVEKNDEVAQYKGHDTKLSNITQSNIAETRIVDVQNRENLDDFNFWEQTCLWKVAETEAGS